MNGAVIDPPVTRTVWLETVSGAAASLWQPIQQPDGTYEFRNQNSGLCLDVYGAGSNLGQQFDQ